MVPKPSSKSKATSFYGTLKFEFQKKIGKISTFSKEKQRAERVNTYLNFTEKKSEIGNLKMFLES